MEEILDMIYVENNLVLTMCHMCVLFLACDVVLGFAHIIGSIKDSISR